MTSTPFLTSSRLLLSALALSNSISPYVFDYNTTHVFNPNWPPHARFHNGQTMSMGLALGLATLYYTWRPLLSSTPFTKAATRDSTFTAAIFMTVYWITGLSAGLYPGAKFMDPEFIGTKYDLKILGLPGQAPIFMAHAVLAWVAYALEVRRLAGVKAA